MFELILTCGANHLFYCSISIIPYFFNLIFQVCASLTVSKNPKETFHWKNHKTPSSMENMQVQTETYRKDLQRSLELRKEKLGSGKLN